MTLEKWRDFVMKKYKKKAQILRIKLWRKKEKAEESFSKYLFSRIYLQQNIYSQEKKANKYMAIICLFYLFAFFCLFTLKIPANKHRVFRQ